LIGNISIRLIYINIILEDYKAEPHLKKSLKILKRSSKAENRVLCPV